MGGASNRWWGPRSDFPWEEDALQHIRDQMPDAEPYRAWHTFTFTARTGHVRELDLLLAAPGGLFLVEIKSHPGRATNNGSTWLMRDERVRTLENPLHFTDQKAKELHSQLEQAARQLNMRERIPRIEAAVFLSAPNLRCEFDEFQRQRVFGRNGLENQTGLPGIWSEFLNAPPRSDARRVSPTLSKQLDKVLHKIGVHGLRKHRRIGPYELEPRAFDAGPTWEDYLAENTALPGDQPRRVRIYLSELGATAADRDSTRRAARREYLALQGISHDGIAAAEQYSDEHEGGPAVVFRHGRNWQRLDQFIAEQGTDLPVDTRVEMVRQLAEAVDHAHRRHLYHRALAARCVYVEMDGRYPRLRICDWQVAARPGSSSTTTATLLGSSGPGASSMARHVELSAGPYLAPEFGSPDAAAAQLDIFGLGALTYLILTGRPPAESRDELGKRLTAQHALVPSTVSDAISPAMDRLVRGATATQPVDRAESVREFLRDLDEVEEELTAPDRAEEPDPLEAGRGAVVAGWTVQRVLGKGSTARALLAERDGQCRVLKVALNGSAAQRLIREAAQLGSLTDSHIVRLVDGPIEVGGRTVVVLEQAGDRTLADQLRHLGPLTIDELENLGEHLLQAIAYLDGQGVWHRDIKPDNLAVRQLQKKGRRLVLFDFSLAGTPDSVVDVGTSDYLDPFLGTDRRPRYDAAAERYAVAVTLHEMASGELPCWGDGVTEPKLLDPAEEMPQLAEDSFDPVLRDRLVSFFGRALHRDAEKRFSSLKEMTRAWTDIFRDLDEAPPLTTRHTLDRADSTDPDAAREAAVHVATAATPLAAAGLTARALSIAQQQLSIATVGELVKIPAVRIMRLRGVGLGPRNELVRRAREWRRTLGVAESAEGRIRRTRNGPAVGDGQVAEVDWSRVNLDEVVRNLVPKSAKGKGEQHNLAEVQTIRLMLALPGDDSRPSPVQPWATQREIAEHVGLSQPYVATLVARARERWAKSVPAVTPLREDVIGILGEHGRVLEARQIASALLARRGSDLDDPAARLALAVGCVRAAIDTEERLENPRLRYRRHGDQVIVAVSAEDDPSAPSEDDLIDYAIQLGVCADELAGRDPLPGLATVQSGLRSMLEPEGMASLSDTDLVTLAAAASRDAAVTARLELYPRGLAPDRALRLSQAASYLGEPGLVPEELRRRVLARFPELARLPDPAGLRTVLRQMGYEVRVTGGKYVLPSGTQVSSAGRASSTWTATPYGAGTHGIEPREEALRRLADARQRGGFVALKARLTSAAAARDTLRLMEGVTAIDVSAEFVGMLRAIVVEQGRPRWETVVAADSSDASPAARTGFGRLLDETWQRMERRIRAAGEAADGIVLLHDATPLARYAGGDHLLARLAAAARQADEAPHGLWLLCPMPDPAGQPRLDNLTVGVIPGDAEQVVIPSGLLIPNGSRRVS